VITIGQFHTLPIKAQTSGTTCKTLFIQMNFRLKAALLKADKLFEPKNTAKIYNDGRLYHAGKKTNFLDKVSLVLLPAKNHISCCAR